MSWQPSPESSRTSVPTRSSPSRRATWSRRGLAALLAGGGSAHFLAPAAYARIVPPQLGRPYLWVYLSGLAELACSAGLLLPKHRRAAALAAAALFVAVFPANLQMALDAQGRSAVYRAVVYARLPLQVPLVLWALTVAARPSGKHRSSGALSRR